MPVHTPAILAELRAGQQTPLLGAGDHGWSAGRGALVVCVLHTEGRLQALCARPAENTQ